MNKVFYFIISMMLGLLCANVTAAQYTVDQKDREFSIKELHVKKGDTIYFANKDHYFHNVYSLSEDNYFDLGTYPLGESRPVKFEYSGEVEVECAIHPDMYMKIHVED